MTIPTSFLRRGRGAVLGYQDSQAYGAPICSSNLAQRTQGPAGWHLNTFQNGAGSGYQTYTMTVDWKLTMDALDWINCGHGAWASFNIQGMSAIYDDSAGWSALNNTYQTLASWTTNGTTCLNWQGDAYSNLDWTVSTFVWTLSGISIHNGDSMTPRTSIIFNTFLGASCPGGAGNCPGSVEVNLGNPSSYPAYFTATLTSVTVTQP